MIFERKHAMTHLLVREEERDGRPAFFFTLLGAYQGTGYREGWGSRNKWRTINAGKKAQARMDSKINGMILRRDSFRRGNRR